MLLLDAGDSNQTITKIAQTCGTHSQFISILSSANLTPSTCTAINFGPTAFLIKLSNGKLKTNKKRERERPIPIPKLTEMKAMRDETNGGDGVVVAGG